MANRNGVVEVIIRARDLTGTALRKFQRQWRATARVVKQVTRAVLAGTAAFAGMVFGLQKLGAQGDKVIAVKSAFTRMVGNATAALETLRAATLGTVDDFELMARSNQLMTLGVADSVEEIAEMVSLSRELGRAQGIDARRSLEIFTLALARQSAMRADDLGLALAGVEASKFQAEFMDQARRKVEALTGGMQAGAPAAVRFATAMTNLKNQVSEFVAQSPLVARFFDTLTDITDGIVSSFAGDTDRLKEGFEALGSFAGNAFAAGFFQVLATALNSLERLILPKWLEDKIATPLAIFGGAAQEQVSQTLDAANAWLEVIRSFSRRPAAGPAGGGRGKGGPAGASMSLSSLDLSRALPAGAAGFAVPGFDPAGIAAFNERRREREAANRARVGDPATTLEPLFGDSGELDEVKDDMEDFGQTAVAAFGAAAAAGIRGSDQIAQSVIHMITSIAQSIPGVGGFAGSVIGAVGGIFGALVSRRDRTVPVRLASVDQAAADALNDRNRGPERVQVFVDGLLVSDTAMDQIQREFYNREQRDEIPRYGGRMGGTPVGIG